jgi:hypothetical protein
MGLTLLHLAYWKLNASGPYWNKNRPERCGSTENPKPVFQTLQITSFIELYRLTTQQYWVFVKPRFHLKVPYKW